MNRIEIVGLFSALEVLCEQKNIEGIEKIVKRVLNEAVTDKEKKEAKTKK
jgi:hypothetical protein